ncbi:hypothetical protein CMV_006709 [Castanea mollissima]|uniref:Leucine-rich repeat-containing N-terminal plant-type domain-containing protein n=1 Tax=Castanea mollissima TaxID=60419 RepID=A0A8J4RP46_9ROSI|nr:hypothetical protein CMV_006709 [Castanea mollissima]
MEASFRPVSFLFLAFLFLPNFLFFFFCAGLSELRCIGTERQALLNFKQDLIDPSNRLSSWTAHGDCCLWEGVVCHNLTAHVHQLHLRSFRPVWDDSMSPEQYDAEYEAYWRSRPFIPPTPTVNFSSFLTLDLVSLDLSGNYFQGPIPVDLQNMTSLSHLDLSGNNFNSSIPNWLYSFSRLEFLNLGGNNLQGTISSAIGNLTSAVSIRIDLPSNRLNQEVSKILEILSRLDGDWHQAGISRIHLERKAAKAALVNFYETLRFEVKDDVGIKIATHSWIGSEITGGKFMLEDGAEMQWK